MSDHIHMLLSIPPKYSIVMVIGYLKDKSDITLLTPYFILLI